MKTDLDSVYANAAEVLEAQIKELKDKALSADGLDGSDLYRFESMIRMLQMIDARQQRRELQEDLGKLDDKRLETLAREALLYASDKAKP